MLTWPAFRWHLTVLWIRILDESAIFSERLDIFGEKNPSRRAISPLIAELHVNGTDVVMYN
jgi:hypothetical protein